MHRRPVIIILFVAIALLAILSVCPWSAWTGGRLKDFNLLSDLLPYVPETIEGVADNVDPELQNIAEISDTIVIDSVAEKTPVIKEIPSDFSAPRVDGIVMLEDYSYDGEGLNRLARTLNQSRERRVRIAMVGDSYIEGDIFAQDIRAGLQSIYGGCGVGYISAFSAFPGFRASVNQASSGWTEHEIRKMKDDPLRTIFGTYFTAQPDANVHFRKSVKPEHVDAWDRTMVVFQSDSDGIIKFSGPEIDDKTFEIKGSPNIQTVCLERRLGDVKLSSFPNGMNVLGIWLEGERGIVFDDISLRGNSGVSHRVLNAPTTEQMRQVVDYDLIILEFGMNALSAQQTNYSAYGNAMVEVVENLKRLYPNAQILIMGVGDRGQKINGEVVSMPTATALIKAQRDAARRTGSLFWDTREAMGGNGAAREWNERKLLNSDYVHLNHRGGKELAGRFVEAIKKI